MNLAKAYEPNEYEPNIYALWEKSGAFRPSGTGEPFSTVMPPPNANGNLHIGHALDMNLHKRGRIGGRAQVPHHRFAASQPISVLRRLRTSCVLHGD